MITQVEKKVSRCGILASPKKLYDTLLFHTYENFGEKQKDDFGFLLRDDLPSSVLESRKPLTWFRELEKRGKLSWKDVDCLVNFLSEASLHALLSEARNYQARIKVVEFFHENLQANLPEICLDNEFNKKQCLEQNLPKNFLKRCQDLFRGAQDLDVNSPHVNGVRCSFSKGVLLLVNSCGRSGSDADLQLAALKLLYLADLFYKRFKKVIVDDKDLLDIKPLSNGRFLARDNRSRKRILANQRRRSSVNDEARQQQLLHRRGSLEFIPITARFCMSLFLGFFASLLRIFGIEENRQEDAFEVDS